MLEKIESTNKPSWVKCAELLDEMHVQFGIVCENCAFYSPYQANGSGLCFDGNEEMSGKAYCCGFKKKEDSGKK